MCGDLSLRKGVKKRRRIGIVPDEDREVAEAPLTTNGLARDQLGHRLGLPDTGHLLDVIDIALVPRRPPAQSFVDPEARLETLGVLRDEPVRSVQQTL